MLRFLQLLNVVGNIVIYHYLLGILYFYSAPVDNIIISLLGYLLFFILSITTTIFTFYYAKKVYTKNIVKNEGA
jgi:hypothetical protein